MMRKRRNPEHDSTGRGDTMDAASIASLEAAHAPPHGADTGDQRAERWPVPPTFLVIGAIVSVQVGSSIARGLFDQLGSGGAAFLRVGLAAVVLLAIWRPRPSEHPPRHLLIAALFGLALAAMNYSFYLALDRAPLGIAVTVEFIGPLAVAVAGSRRALDLVWVILAAGGILLLAPVGEGTVPLSGLAFALLAGSLWAAYIVLSARVGAAFSGGQGLAIAMIVGGVCLIPIGIADAGSHLLRPELLVGGAAIALLSSLVPYSLEMEALRSIPTRVFGVLMSLEPAVAALMGFLVLHQVLGPRALAALALITAASLGASRASPTGA